MAFLSLNLQVGRCETALSLFCWRVGRSSPNTCCQVVIGGERRSDFKLVNTNVSLGIGSKLHFDINGLARF